MSIDKEKFKAFKEKNQGFNLKTFNFSDAASLQSLQGLGTGEETAPNLEQLKGLQRLSHFISQEDHAIHLYNAGMTRCVLLAQQLLP